MENFNGTMVVYFIIEGISDSPQFQIIIFLLVLLLYLITFGGNFTIILLVCLDQHLQSPMYFFLSNLSILDIFSSTITLHKILITFVTGNKSISYAACITQMYLFGSLTCDELLILTAMSYDRYVAICNPLRYTLVMNWTVCSLLATACWVLGFLEIAPLSGLLMGFSCYRSNVINHFFCDPIQVMKLSCSDTSIFNIVLITEISVLLFPVPFLLKCTSYVFIIMTILRISSSAGRRKAFSTCSSHLTVVLLLYMTLSYQYLFHTLVDSVEYTKLFSLFNTVLLPILNPLIYSFKNKDVKSAFKRQLRYFNFFYMHAICKQVHI
ncbi:olfactory receptor 6C74-like [Aquarana catesbeiana]|uniref:olfactory receptor 6C74-like n=1 Tax=Aquarana catesbeiana TaxID=8400 RepID=UPI003CC9B629